MKHPNTKQALEQTLQAGREAYLMAVVRGRGLAPDADQLRQFLAGEPDTSVSLAYLADSFVNFIVNVYEAD